MESSLGAEIVQPIVLIWKVTRLERKIDNLLKEIEKQELINKPIGIRSKETKERF